MRFLTAVTVAFLLVAPAAAVVTLGTSNQNFKLTGIGANAQGQGRSQFGQVDAMTDQQRRRPAKSLTGGMRPAVNQVDSQSESGTRGQTPAPASGPRRTPPTSPGPVKPPAT